MPEVKAGLRVPLLSARLVRVEMVERVSTATLPVVAEPEPAWAAGVATPNRSERISKNDVFMCGGSV